MSRARCDCHLHVFSASDRHPRLANRRYDPPPAGIGDFLAVSAPFDISRFVLVQPSIYGSDHTLLLETLARYPQAARGVAAYDPCIEASAVEEMHRGGVRGMRLVILEPAKLANGDAAGMLRHAAALCRPHGWHLELLTDLGNIPFFAGIVSSLDVHLVFGHMGRPDAASTLLSEGFTTLKDLIAAGRCWVKISGLYLYESIPAAAIDRFATELIDANVERILWGSDWPHIDPAASPGTCREDVFLSRSYGHLIDRLEQWTGFNASRLSRILSTNPGALYGY